MDKKGNFTMKKIIYVLLALIMVCTMLPSCSIDAALDWANKVFNTNQEPEIEWEEKVYWTGDINSDFLPGEIIVVLDKAISEVNKVHSKEFFGGVQIEKIIDLSYTEKPLPSDIVFRQTLHIILCEKTKEAVIEAIRIIEQIPGIRSVEPNTLFHIDGAIPDDPFFSFSDDWTDQWGLEKAIIHTSHRML